jgi:serine/threonine protein kinase/tetratricopeptide (TPR) repeat protein
MQKERWQEINRIFHAALDLPPDDRPSFVSTAAPNDPDLQSEVERLLAADLKAESYLESPLIPTGALNPAFADAPQLPPGHVLCERFHILRTVGSGGMGQVFEAYDSELGVNVALKLIRPEIAANPQARARFRQEVRLARRITHPNVCRTYDVDRDTLPNPSGPPQPVVFLTMEFLPGETLAERLKRTPPLTLEEILAIARQIAAALDAAHALGIIHRDIKPGNIMLVPPGENSRQAARVVITDFGLARLDPNAAPFFHGAEHSITNHSSQANQPIGTLAYMAPEQMDGRPVSAATDIYAFGLLLFEMATGQRAFPSSNLLSGIAQRLTGPAPSPRTLNADLPESIERAIQGCLQRNPQDRFPTAQAVLDCLTGLAPSGQPEPPTIQPQTEPAKPQLIVKPRLTPRLTLIAATILPLAVSLFLLGDRYSWWRGNPAVPPGALVYLAPVKNETGEKSLDNITELLRASLEQSAQINLLDQGRVGDTLQLMTKAPDAVIDPPIAREIAMRTGAVRVIFASVVGKAEGYHLNIDIQQPDGGDPQRYVDQWQQSFPWRANAKATASVPADLLTAIQHGSDWIRKEVGESRNDIARLDVPPEDVTTRSWQALADYTQAEKLISKGKREEAVVLLQSAVTADPQFALAYGTLGDVLDSIGRSAEGCSYYTKALSVDMQNRLTRRERDKIRGMFALDTGDERSAESAFRDYAVYYEHDYAGWFFRAYPLMMLGRTDEAIETLKKAFEIDNKRLSAPAHLARFYLAKDDHASAWEWQAWLKANGFTEDANFARGQIDLDEQKYSDAEKSFRAMLQSSDPAYQSLAWSLLARYHAERGDYTSALDALNQGIDIDTAHGFIAQRSAKLVDRASVHGHLLDLSDVIPDIRRAVKDDSGLQTIQSAALALGRCRASTQGKLDTSVLRELKHLQAMLPKDQAQSVLATVTTAILQGEFSLAQGDWRSAMKQFGRADALEAPLASREYMARVYSIASQKEPDARERLKFRQMSLDISAQTIHRQPVLWYLMLVLPPGVYGDTLAAYLHLGVELHIDPKTLEPYLIQFSKLRKSQFESAPDLVNALISTSDSGKPLTIQTIGEPKWH